jgi:hypothetical protein
MPMSDRLRAERENAERQLDRLEKKPAPTAPAPAPRPRRSHLDPSPRKRPEPLSDKDQKEALEAIAEHGATPETVDGFLASRFRDEPLEPRRWSVEGFGAGMTKGVVDTLRRT